MRTWLALLLLCCMALADPGLFLPNESLISYEYGNATGYYETHPTAGDVESMTATICLGIGIIILVGVIAFFIIRRYLMVEEL